MVFCKKFWFKLDTKKPLSVKVYEDLFDKINQKITDRVYNEAINEMLLSAELDAVVVGTETAARNILLAKRTIRAIDNGQKPHLLVPLQSKNMANKKVRVITLAMSAGLGGLIGFVFIAINFAIRKRKEN